MRGILSYCGRKLLQREQSQEGVSLMNPIDISINKVCVTCGRETPLRFLHRQLFPLSEHSIIGVRIDPDEFLLCATCGNPLRLRIQAQPYALANHLDTPVAKQLYQQQLRDEKIPPPKKEAMTIMGNPNYLSEMFGNREDRTTAEIIGIATSLKDREAMSCDTWIWPNMKLTITLDNQLELPLLSVDLVVGHGFYFKPHDNKSHFQWGDDIWHYSGYMTLHDIVQSFRLENSNLITPDPLPPGTWSGWRIISFGIQIPDHLVLRDFPAP